MSGFDWRSEQAYANFEKAETVDIAWEWLRRDSEYHKDYGALTIPARLNGATDDFRHKWGLSFSQLTPKRRSIDNRFSGRRRLCHPSCRCAK
ncbi:transcriptional regulator domain-containing protein [Bradyrhizobium sp. TZ2]